MSTRRLIKNELTPPSNISRINANIGGKTHAIGSLRRHLIYQRYGLQENPFGATPNPRYIYQSRTHAEARSSLVIGIECGVGFQALIAPPGMGKTMILRQLLERFDGAARTAFLFQVQGDSRDFLSYLLTELGIDPDPADVVQAQAALNRLLLAEFRARRQTIVAVDEAQNLSPSILETLRQLSNFETSGEKLLQIVLAGQPQLAEKLADPALAQLRQRISIFATLAPFDLEETTHYVEHRLRLAGFENPPLFTAEAMRLVWEHSGGIPRTINQLCFNALLLASASQQRHIEGSVVREVIDDRDLELIRSRPEATPASIRARERSAAEAAARFRPQSTTGDDSPGLMAPSQQEVTFCQHVDSSTGTSAESSSPAWPSRPPHAKAITDTRSDSLTTKNVPPVSDSIQVPPLPCERVKSRWAWIQEWCSDISQRRYVLALAAAAGVSGVALLAIFSAEHSGRKAVIKQLAGTTVRAPAPSLLLEQPASHMPNDHVPATRHLEARSTLSRPAQPQRILQSAANRPVIQVAAAAPKPVARRSDELPALEPPPISLIRTKSEPSDVSLTSILPGPVVPSEQSIRISEGGGGELIYKNSPVYPSWAKEQRLEGDVILQVLIDRQGRPKTVQLVSGSNAFASAAINAVKRWRYQPLYLDGQVVEWTTTITLRFRLPEGN